MSEPTAPTLSLDSNHFCAQNINTSLHHTQIVHQTVSNGRDPIDILRKKVAFGALYNSRERFDPPKCHPQTRTAILERIDRWAAGQDEESKPIMWLSGPAGAGKSAIAQTAIEKWKKENHFVLAFFFWRTSTERNQGTRLVPTLAFELLELFPAVRPKIEAAITPGGLFKKKLAFQLQKLVVEPLREMSASQGHHPVVIVVDGLDECCRDLPEDKDFPGQTFESQQQEILEAFGSACREVSHLRLLIVSRPERQIRSSFGTRDLQTITTSLSLKDNEDASADIRLFLDCSFQELRERHGIESSWPTEEQLSELVRKSSGQFIYPSIAMKHITRTRVNPKQSLMAVLELRPGSVKNPLAELDMLYTLVLESVAAASLPVVTDILGYILPYRRNFASLQEASRIYITTINERSILMFENFLFLSEGEGELHLDDLHSVLDIPSRTTGRPISFLHATFSEYLCDNSRSGNFFIDPNQFVIRYSQLLFRHLNEWNLHPDAQIYDGRMIIGSSCAWICDCPPSKSLMVQVRSLMIIKLRNYPMPSSHVHNNSPSLPSRQLCINFDSYLKVFDTGKSNYFSRGLLKFLQRCNIPEIEPSWWRRRLVRWSLESALQRHPGYN